MGGQTYSYTARSSRAISKGYTTVNAVNMINTFTQMKERKSHDSMQSQGITLREARDSEEHPETTPIIFALDVTGSMGHIPRMMIKDGIPNLIKFLDQKGIAHPAILFLAIGDHETDNAPLQVAQFESGDEELDMWLERTWPEGGGGGNGGESYGLAHYFAARHCKTDSWEKRGKKGYLFTIGDDENLKSYPTRAMKEVMDNGDIKTFSDTSILAEAQEQWHVFHIDPHGNYGHAYWAELLRDNYVELTDHNLVPKTVADLICRSEDCIGDNSNKLTPIVDTLITDPPIKPVSFK